MHFAMFVRDKNEKPFHHFTQSSENSRLPDLNLTDMTSWNKQYPELNAHRTDEWKDRQILICDASIKVETQRRPRDAELGIEYIIKGQHGLLDSAPLQCRSRFYEYDSRQLTKLYDETKQADKEAYGDTSYAASPTWALKFGSPFWAHRLSALRSKLADVELNEEQSTRSKLALSVRRSLQYMTAVQDIYGTKEDTGEQHCFLTILWRFNQTRTANESGRMTWRVVNFPAPVQQASWVKGEEADTSKDLKFILNSTTSSASTSMYPSLPLELPHQPFAHHPGQLDLEPLSAISIDDLNTFSNPNSATAPSMTTDYSQHSLPSLSHSQDTHPAHGQDFHDANDIDFNGGHITMHLEPAINFGSYDTYNPHTSSLTPIAGIAALEHVHESGFGDLSGLGVNLTNCYPHKPWPYNDLISRMEGVAEQQTHTYDTQASIASGHDVPVVGHGVLHDGNLGQGLWKLQTGFEDTSVGAVDGIGVGTGDGRKDSVAAAQGILEMIERDQREGRVRGY
jgi:transcriptional enhancer factor